jgi:tripartite-type tricarboxylate transporter receptor subunit TctC
MKRLVVAALCFAALSVQGQTFPSKPLRLVVPYPPGGVTDILGRALGQFMSDSLGQPVIIDNKPGAGGAIGTEAIAKSAPDGYTFGLGASSTHVLNPMLYKLNYDPVKDFSPIGLATAVPLVMVVNPVTPVNNVAELLAWIKANPGKANYGSYGNASLAHLAGELFKSMTKVDMTHVPYKGSAPAMLDLLAGRVQLMFDNLASALPNIRAGKVRALAVTTRARTSFQKDLPTMEEAGVPGFDLTTWWGVMAPARTPPDVVDRLAREIQVALELPEVKEKLRAMGSETPSVRSPAEFTAFVAREAKIYGELVKRSGATAD